MTEKTNTGWQGSGADVRPCSCKDTYQDERYKSGNRVKNRCRGGWRCTCCGIVEKR